MQLDTLGPAHGRDSTILAETGAGKGVEKSEGLAV